MSSSSRRKMREHAASRECAPETTTRSRTRSWWMPLSDRRDAVVFRVAEAIDAILERKKWRVADLLQAVAFDDRGQDKCSPRALCKLPGRCERGACSRGVATRAEDADYARFIGEPRSISASRRRPRSGKILSGGRRRSRRLPWRFPRLRGEKSRAGRRLSVATAKPSAAQAAKDAEEAGLAGAARVRFSDHGVQDQPHQSKLEVVGVLHAAPSARMFPNPPASSAIE